MGYYPIVSPRLSRSDELNLIIIEGKKGKNRHSKQSTDRVRSDCGAGTTPRTRVSASPPTPTRTRHVSTYPRAAYMFVEGVWRPWRSPARVVVSVEVLRAHNGPSSGSLLHHSIYTYFFCCAPVLLCSRAVQPHNINAVILRNVAVPLFGRIHRGVVRPDLKTCYEIPSQRSPSE